MGDAVERLSTDCTVMNFVPLLAFRCAREQLLELRRYRAAVR